MVDQELLQALRGVVKEEIQPIHERLDKMDERLDKLESRMSNLEEQTALIKEDTAITRETANALVEWAERVSVITRVEFPVEHIEKVQ